MNKSGAFFAGLVVLICAMAYAVIVADPTPTTWENRRLFGLWRMRHAALFLVALLIAVFLLVLSIGKQAHKFYFAGSILTAAVFYALLELIGQVGILSWEMYSGSKAGGLKTTDGSEYRTWMRLYFQDRISPLVGAFPTSQ